MKTSDTLTAGVIGLTSPGLIAAAYHLHTHSALTYCTKIDHWDGDTIITTVRPADTLSSGEKVLWSALSHMAGGAGVLDLDSPAIDDLNRRALAEAVELWESLR